MELKHGRKRLLRARHIPTARELRAEVNSPALPGTSALSQVYQLDSQVMHGSGKVQGHIQKQFGTRPPEIWIG